MASFRGRSAGSFGAVFLAALGMVMALQCGNKKNPVTDLGPQVTLQAPATVRVGDTATFTALAVTGGAAIASYSWTVDSFAFTTGDSVVRWVFDNRAGMHKVRLWVTDVNGLSSGTDSAEIQVVYSRPLVTISPKDTSIYSIQSLLFHASATDSVAPIASYRWAIDGRRVSGAQADSLLISWNAASSGPHLVSVIAVNSDSIESLPDTALILVKSGGPCLSPIRDTMLPSSDTLAVTCIAADPNGSIVKYLWNYSGRPGWDDSTTSPSYKFAYMGAGSVTVIVAARDSNGLVGSETFKIRFNRQPDSVQVTAPGGPGDTVIIPPSLASYTASFAFKGFDPENDSLAFSVQWGTSADSMHPIYIGYGNSAQAGGVLPGRYFWKVSGSDQWGRSCSKSGTLTVVRQYRICFIGHSYVAGQGGDGINGGFRGPVIDSIRKALGPWVQLKPVGPAITPFMGRSTCDDSCLAIVGALGGDIVKELVYVATQLTADIWVLSIGVNDNGYNPTGLSSTIQILDLMRGRNPDGRIYVLNAIPCTAISVYFLTSYDRGLDSVITLRNSQGGHMFRVDAAGGLSPNWTPDTSLFSADGLHPNQKGYYILADSIVATMRRSSPPAIPWP